MFWRTYAFAFCGLEDWQFAIYVLELCGIWINREKLVDLIRFLNEFVCGTDEKRIVWKKQVKKILKNKKKSDLKEGL